MNYLIKAYGGTLQNLLVTEERAAALKKESQVFPSITLSQRQLCDLELLMNGAFSPLRGYMDREVYEGVLERMRLPNGLLWSMPITLDVPDVIAEKLEAGGYLGLNDPEGFMLAMLHIVDKWKPDKWKLPRSYTCISSGRDISTLLVHETDRICLAGC
jgi:sulfate adenylyltransferase